MEAGSKVSTLSITLTVPSALRCSSMSICIWMPKRSNRALKLSRPFRPDSSGVMSYSRNRAL